MIYAVKKPWMPGRRRIHVPSAGGRDAAVLARRLHGFYNALWYALPMLAVALA
jgi:hypothetical protein